MLLSFVIGCGACTSTHGLPPVFLPAEEEEALIREAVQEVLAEAAYPLAYVNPRGTYFLTTWREDRAAGRWEQVLVKVNDTPQGYALSLRVDYARAVGADAEVDPGLVLQVGEARLCLLPEQRPEAQQVERRLGEEMRQRWQSRRRHHLAARGDAPP